MGEIRTTGSRVVYENPWLRVREDRIERPDGASGLYSVIEKLDFSLVVPLDTQGFHLIEQYRYPVRSRYWEFPQGIWDDRPDADPLAVAQEELEAETGLTATSIQYLGHIFGAYGLTAQRCHVFVADGLTPGTPRPDPEEQGLRVRRVPFSTFPDLIRRGEVRDAASIAAYALLALRRPASEAAASLHAPLDPNHDRKT